MINHLKLIDKIGDNDMKTACLNVGRMINKVTGKKSVLKKIDLYEEK